jgi:hypothetical protein
VSSWGFALAVRCAAALVPQQLRQLRHVDRNPPRLIFCEQLGRQSPTRLILIIDRRVCYEENGEGDFTCDLSTSVFDFFASFFAFLITFFASFLTSFFLCFDFFPFSAIASSVLLGKRLQ